MCGSFFVYKYFINIDKIANIYYTVNVIAIGYLSSDYIVHFTSKINKRR